MIAAEPLRHDGKRVLVVVVGATGMGAAAAIAVSQLGAEVVVMDRSPIAEPTHRAILVDLRDRSSIDRALDDAGGPFDSVIGAAGVADGTPGLMRINFLAHRRVIRRLVAGDLIPSGGAICMVSSGAGLGWEAHLETLAELDATESFDDGVAWVEQHPGTDNYMFSEQAVNYFAAHEAFALLRRGIRINAIVPGPTDTPLARANADLWLGFAQGYRDATGTSHLTAQQMGDAIAFLNSDAASGISGVTLPVDAGHTASSVSGSYTADRAIVMFMLGRTSSPVE